MVEKSVITTTKSIEIGIYCDVCGKRFDIYESPDSEEIGEFTKISYIGGYASIFGDQSLIQIDICQHCLKEKLGKFLTIIPEGEY